MSESPEEKETLARAELPYKAEYCKTNRAKCKACKEVMEKDSVKMAIRVKYKGKDFHMTTYYHVPCFFQIKRPTSVAEICSFETLKYEDQMMIQEAVDTKGLSVLGTKVSLPTQKNEKSKEKIKSKKSTKRAPTETVSDVPLVNYNDYTIECKKSGRKATCKVCTGSIEKNMIRIGRMDFDTKLDTNFAGPFYQWYHLECFPIEAEIVGFFGLVEKIPNFDMLEDEHKKMCKEVVKPIKPSESSSKKIKKEVIPEVKKGEDSFKEQSDRFFKLRQLVETMKKKDIEALLNHMKQRSSFRTPSLLTDMATDVLLFGPLAECPECKQQASFVLRSGSYICTKELPESGLCTYETREPKRRLPDVPDELVEKYPFFEEQYKFVGGNRIFPSTLIKAVEQKELEINKIALAGKPLKGLTIGVISFANMLKERPKIVDMIKTFGGKFSTNINNEVFVILSTEKDLASDETSSKLEVAKELNIPFAKHDFLFNIETEDDFLPQLKTCLIGDWDGDIEERCKTKRGVTEN